MKCRRILGMAMAAVLALTCVTGCSTAPKEYPSEDITILIPRGAGGGTDTSARGLIEFAKDKLPKGVQFLPTNKPEGSGVACMIEGANADPDGYTLTMLIVEAAMLPHVGRMDATVEDFKGICAPIADPAALIVPANAPYNTLEEFIEYAKEHPGEIQVANPGIGGIMHMAAVNVEETCDVEFVHVPYPDGTGACIAALVGGHVDATFGTPGTALSQVEAGTLKILGVMDSTRCELFPDVPTFQEAIGLDFEMRAWAVLSAPKDIPDDVYEKLVTIFKETMEDPAYQEYTMKQGIVPSTIVGEEADQMMKADNEVYAELMQLVADQMD